MSQYYSMSICTPARAALMTGRYPVRYGLQYNVIQPGAPWGLPLGEKVRPIFEERLRGEFEATREQSKNGQTFIENCISLFPPPLIAPLPLTTGGSLLW